MASPAARLVPPASVSGGLVATHHDAPIVPTHAPEREDGTDHDRSDGCDAGVSDRWDSGCGKGDTHESRYHADHDGRLEPCPRERRGRDDTCGPADTQSGEPGDQQRTDRRWGGLRSSRRGAVSGWSIRARPNVAAGKHSDPAARDRADRARRWSRRPASAARRGTPGSHSTRSRRRQRARAARLRRRRPTRASAR